MGKFDGLKVCGKFQNKYSVCFKHIYNKSTDQYFRNHSHVLITKKQYKDMQDYQIGQMVEFTAETYTYNKTNKQTFITRTQQGLQNILKIESPGDQHGNPLHHQE